MVPADTINELTEQVELHKNLAIGYAQALRGEGITLCGAPHNVSKR